MRARLVSLIATVAIFSLLDFIWLSTVAFSFYEREIGGLLLPAPNWSAGLAFYGMYMAGIYYFAVMPGVTRRSPVRALVNGVVFGLMAYGTYDLTNMATLAGWSWSVVALDMAWGMFATGLTALLATALARRF